VKKIYITLILLLLILMSACSSPPGHLEYEGKAEAVVNYISAEQNQYGTGIIFEDGSYLRFLGAYEVEAGTVYHIKYHPSEQEPTWNIIEEVE